MWHVPCTPTARIRSCDCSGTIRRGLRDCAGRIRLPPSAAGSAARLRGRLPPWTGSARRCRWPVCRQRQTRLDSALKRFACERAGPEARPTDRVIDAMRSHVPSFCTDADELAAMLKASVNRRFTAAQGQRIAVIGAGPAGLSAAHDLALMGFKPVVFETEPYPAGMLMVGIPEYRLPRELIAKEVAVIRALGVDIRCGVTVGKDISLADLRRDFAAIIIAVGAKSSRALGLPGDSRAARLMAESICFVRWRWANRLDVGREVVVIGGGNVAYDVVRTVLRQIAYDTARTPPVLPASDACILSHSKRLRRCPLTPSRLSKVMKRESNVTTAGTSGNRPR